MFKIEPGKANRFNMLKELPQTHCCKISTFYHSIFLITPFPDSSNLFDWLINWVPDKNFRKHFRPKNKTEEAKLLQSKEGFEDSLSSTSTIIDWIPLEESDSMSCATKSQLIRMFGFRHPIVGPGKVELQHPVSSFLTHAFLI